LPRRAGGSSVVISFPHPAYCKNAKPGLGVYGFGFCEVAVEPNDRFPDTHRLVWGYLAHFCV